MEDKMKRLFMVLVISMFTILAFTPANAGNGPGPAPNSGDGIPMEAVILCRLLPAQMGIDFLNFVFGLKTGVLKSSPVFLYKKL
jgi:hypothetical protein